MSSVIEEVTAGLREARNSLRIAEERLDAYMQGTVILPAGVTYQDLKDEVTACRAVVAGAQRNYDNTIAAQNRRKLVV